MKGTMRVQDIDLMFVLGTQGLFNALAGTWDHLPLGSWHGPAKKDGYLSMREED